MTREPSLPFFEFDRADPSFLHVHDRAGYVHQEPPELEEHGPAEIFDAEGRVAELAVEDWVVVVRGWSPEPDLPRFDARLRAAAPFYLRGEDLSGSSTGELRVRLAAAARRWEREHTLSWPFLQKLFGRLLGGIRRRT